MGSPQPHWVSWELGLYGAGAADPKSKTQEEKDGGAFSWEVEAGSSCSPSSSEGCQIHP